MNQIIIRQFITFVIVKDGKSIELANATTPADNALPLPGDEVIMPGDIASAAGFINGTFKVISRRFHYFGLPEGVGGAVTLFLSHPS